MVILIFDLTLNAVVAVGGGAEDLAGLGDMDLIPGLLRTLSHNFGILDRKPLKLCSLCQ